MVLLLGVVIVAASCRRGPVLLATLLTIAAFDFFFVPPYHTFNIHDTAYFLTFAVMLAVALTMSRLTARIREQRQATADRERHTATLYALDHELTAAPDLPALIRVIATHLGRSAGGLATVITDEDLGHQDAPAWPADPLFDDPAVRVAGAWALSHQEPAGWGTRQCAEAPALLVPLGGETGLLALVVIRPEDPQQRIAGGALDLVRDQAQLAAGTWERQLMAEHSQRARAEVEAERLRTALLSSLSHDLRTPLASIEGAASSLLDDPGSLTSADHRELLESILEESRRMNRLVTNLLNMIRVETGELAVRKSWQPLEESLGVALLRMEEDLREHPVVTRLPPDLPLVPVDELLLEQVFLNLLENAVRHTPMGTSIEISAWRGEQSVVVEVADGGPGVPAGEEEAVFGRFYRVKGDAADAGAGSGLGLTICRGIITAHGGRIWVEPQPAGGLAVRFTLPLVGPAVGPVPLEPSVGKATHGGP